MRFSHKLKKVLNRDAWQSARATLSRLSYPLEVKPFVEAIDREGFARLQERYGRLGEKVHPHKYLNLEEWMRTNVKRIRDHAIRAAPPKLRILDLGSGSGYFLYIAKCLGHDVLGLDVDTEPIFRDTFALLDLPRVIFRIEPFQALPDLGAPFDIVTAHMTCFNRRTDHSHWGQEEWAYFLADLQRHLQPMGRIQMDLNALADGRHMDSDLKKYLRSRGAKIDRRKVYFNLPLKRLADRGRR